MEIEALAEVSKERRLKRKIRQEKKREFFVQQRRAKPSTLKAEKKHELKVRKREQRQKVRQQTYAEQQKILKNFRESVVKIPPKQEVGLEEVK